MIPTASHRYHRPAREAGLSVGAFMLGRHWSVDDKPPYHLLDAKSKGKVKVKAEVNHGRWIVKCPSCPGAQMAHEDGTRFICVDCGDGPYDISWPRSRTSIEEVLEERPDPANRNYIPGETVAALRRENRERLGGDG